jgi:2-polyprenyl-6-hydroxyphenyl methylase/3-demethylubiquinone-9 3-methyltransferase
MNPWRVPYFRRTLSALGIDPHASRALEVGCGGGLLTEEIVAMGFTVTGIDPSGRSLEIARAHAARSGARIDYRHGYGHELPFEAASFDAAFCCDVLEHVRDWDAVVGEIARVLRPGGAFLFDTINRTASSRIRSIFIAQEWSWTRYAPRHTHVREMFIRPEELAASCERHAMRPQPVVGTAPGGNPLKAIWLIRQYSRGRITSADFGRRLRLTEGPVVTGSYMGHAIRS